MSYINNKYQILTEMIDPLYEKFNGNYKITSIPVISRITRRVINEQVNYPEAAQLSVWMMRAHGSINVGNYWAYGNSDSTSVKGTVYFKKFTSGLTITEDQLNRIQKNGMGSIIERQIEQEVKMNNQQFAKQLERYAINPWNGATTAADYDANLNIGLYMSSSAGTVQNPKDLNGTAGTPEALSAAYNLSGTAQTVNNITRLLAVLKTGTVKFDYLSKEQLVINDWAIYTDPLTKAVLDSTTEILNSTTGQRSEMTYTQILAQNGIQVYDSIYLNQSHTALSSGTATTLYFVGNLSTDYEMWVLPPPDGEDVWSQWEKIPITVNGLRAFGWEKHKKLECAFVNAPYYLYTSATAASWFKPVFAIAITPYENT